MGAVKVLKHFETPKEEGLHYRLICLTGQRKGDAYFIMGNRLVMGRSEKADIRVYDIKSSREHAEIAKVGKDFVITDLGSQNGVVVNDLKIKQHSLKDGDKIIIGKTVYKFNEVQVKGKESPKDVEDDDEYDKDEFDEEEEQPKGNGKAMLLGVVIVGALYVLFSGDDNKEVETRTRKKSKYNVQEITDPFTASLKNKRKEDKNSKMKLNIYFQKGLREFREGNYFRAMSEFNHALSWSPNDPLAEFYLRKTKEALDKNIDAFFIKAKRNEEGLKFSNAVVQYCAIIRLLHNYPNDDRYKNALEGIKNMEEKMGMDEGEIECAKEIK
jgi:pSer/pThr/pTyr-binding forkhead associated (FHA) protein